MPSEEQIVEELISKTQEGAIQWRGANSGGAALWRYIRGNCVYEVPNVEVMNVLGISPQDPEYVEITARIDDDYPITLGTREDAIRLSNLIGEGRPKSLLDELGRNLDLS